MAVDGCRTPTARVRQPLERSSLPYGRAQDLELLSDASARLLCH